MKASVGPSKRMIDRLNQDVYADTLECCQDNNAMFLIALNMEFGFGHDRCMKVIRRYNMICDKYAEMRGDGFTKEEMHQRIVDDLACMGIKESTVYTRDNDFTEARQLQKHRDRNMTNIPRKDCITAYNQLQAMKNLLLSSEG